MTGQLFSSEKHYVAHRERETRIPSHQLNWAVRSLRIEYWPPFEELLCHIDQVSQGYTQRKRSSELLDLSQFESLVHLLVGLLRDIVFEERSALTQTYLKACSASKLSAWVARVFPKRAGIVPTTGIVLRRKLVRVLYSSGSYSWWGPRGMSLREWWVILSML